MSTYEVVTAITEIARLNNVLGQQLRRKFRFKTTREITYPSNHHTGTVFFESASGTNVRAWSPNTEPNKLVNFMLAGDPEATDWMQIDVQLNFPAKTYNRMMAGAFVTDEHGDTFIAHRGKLTKGKSGLKKAKVFREFASRTIEASDDKLTSKLILISALDDSALPDRLWEFAIEAREVATRIGLEGDDEPEEAPGPNRGTTGGKTGGKKPGGKSKDPRPNSDPLLKLRAYFDEYAGEGSHKGHGGGKRTVEHGDIVKALEALVGTVATSQKAQAIDLAIVDQTAVHLYEVKTSARTPDVYTGVGQMLIHGECIHELLGLAVTRYLVLPERPRDSHGRHLYRKAGITVITFEKQGAGYHFSGLP